MRTRPTLKIDSVEEEAEINNTVNDNTFNEIIETFPNRERNGHSNDRGT